MPLLVRIYKLLINEIHNLLEEKKDEMEEYDEENEYDEEENENEAVDEDAEENAGGDDDDLDLKDEIEIDENGADGGDLNNYLSKHDRKRDEFYILFLII